MNKYVVLVAGILLSAQVVGAEWGVTGAVGTSNEIRLPIKNQGLVVEPFLSYSVNKSQAEFTSRLDYRQSGIGVGVWKSIPVSETIFVQLGGQLGYVESTEDYDYSHILSAGEISGSQYSEQKDGYMFAPGGGVFYQFNAKFEAGLEIKYRYEHQSGERERLEAAYPDYAWSEQPTAKANSTNASLQTQVIVRIYF